MSLGLAVVPEEVVERLGPFRRQGMPMSLSNALDVRLNVPIVVDRLRAPVVRRQADELVVASPERPLILAEDALESLPLGVVKVLGPVLEQSHVAFRADDFPDVPILQVASRADNVLYPTAHRISPISPFACPRRAFSGCHQIEPTGVL